MATNKKFNVRHGLSAGTGSTQRDIVSDAGLVYDVGLLSDLTTEAKTNTVAAINELAGTFYAKNEPMGLEDRTHSVISFNESNRTFSIAPNTPTVSSYVVWNQGRKRSISTTKSIAIPNTTGLWYIYFDSNFDLQYKSGYFTWEEDTHVAYVYWNSATGKAPFVADERHGVAMDWATHEYLHRTRGTAIADGFSISVLNPSGTGSLDTDAQVNLGNGTFFDEDLEVYVSHSATPTSGTFTQILQGPAQIPVFYQSGAPGQWVRDTATLYPAKTSATTLQYNGLSGGTWSTATVTDGQYCVSWIVATNDISSPVLAILGQSDYATSGAAEAALFSDLVLSNFPIVEFRPLWKVVFQTSAAYANAPNGRISNVLDIRRLETASGAGVAVSDHGLLTGLSDDDHYQYLHTTVTRTGVTAEFNTTGKITTTDKVGVGTTTPAALIESFKDWGGSSSTNLSFASTSFRDATRFSLRRANGTPASPSTILSGEELGNFNFRGHDGTSFTSAGLANVGADAEETYTATSRATRLRFGTTNVNETSVSNRMFLTGAGELLIGTEAKTSTAYQLLQVTGGAYVSGSVGIGTTAPAEKLHVVGNALITGTLTAGALSTGATGTGVNISNSGTITGPSTITIDPAAIGDDTGTVSIKGNLEVLGTTTTINSTTLTVADKNIVLANGVTTLANLDTAGIDFGSTAVRLRYNYNGGTNSGLSIEGANVGIGTSIPLSAVHALVGASRFTIETSFAEVNSPLNMWNNSSSATAGSGMVFSATTNLNQGIDAVFIGGVSSQRIGTDFLNSRTAFRVLSNGVFTDTSSSGAFYLEGSSTGVKVVANAIVGIGTTNPTVPLDVFGSSAQLRVRDANVDVRILPLTASGAGIIGTWSNHDLVLNANNTEISRFKPSGNVGIGTTNPRGRLDVTTPGAVYNTDALVIGSGSLTYPTSQYSGWGGIVVKGITSDARMFFQDGQGRINSYWNAYLDTGGYKYIVSNEPAAREQMSVAGTTGGYWGLFGAPAGTAGQALGWTQTAYIESGTSGVSGAAWISPRGTSSDFYISNAGTVGIGTITPAGKLHVRDDGTLLAPVCRSIVQSTDQRTIVGSYWVSGVTQYGYIQSTNNAESVMGALALNPAGGNVGVGTANPATPLHVKVASNTGITVDATSGYPAIWWAENGVNKWSATSNLNADSSFVIRESSVADRFTIKPGGNVGIGTTNPLFNLHVIGTTDPGGMFFDTYGIVAPNITGRRANGTTTAPTAVVINDNLLALGARGYNGTEFSTNRATIFLRASENWTTTANGTRMEFITTPVGTTGQVTRMILDDGGNLLLGPTPIAATGTANQRLQVNSGAYISGSVGIGTTNPESGSKVKIYNGNYTSLNITADSEQSIFLNSTDGLRNSTLFNSYGNVGLIGYGQGSNYIFYHYNGNGTFNTQYTYFQVAGSEVLRLVSSGNVGIGTTNPGAKLTVWGPVTIGTNNTFDQGTVQAPFKLVNNNSSLGGGGAIINELYSAGTPQPGYIARFARGTEASPLAVAADDRLAFFVGGGYGTTQFHHTASVDIYSEEAYTDSARGSYIRFTTTSVGQTTRVEKLRITGAGRVGIGVTNPQSTLAVNGYITESTDGGVTYHNVVTQQDVGLLPNQIPLNQYLGQLAFMDTYSPSGLRRIGGGADDLFISTDGFVGIGTTNPDRKLQVWGATLGSTAGDTDTIARFTGLVGNRSNLDILTRRTSNGSTWGTSEARLQYNIDDDTVKRSWISFFNATGVTSENTIRFGEAIDTEWMRISDGNVGIGTTNPTTKFDVIGNARIGGAAPRSVNGLTVGFTSNTAFATNTDVGDVNRTISLINESATTNAMSILGFRVNPGTPTTNAMLDMKFVQTGGTNTSALHYTFNHDGSTTFVDRFTILSSGNIGIGTTNPSARIHIENSNTTFTSPGDTNTPSIYLLNGNANSATAHSTVAVRTNGANSGDPFISFDIGGVIGWSAGIDNSDNDIFKISNNWADLGTSNRLAIATNGQTNFTVTYGGSPANMDVHSLLAFSRTTPLDGVTYSGLDARLFSFTITPENEVAFRAANATIVSTNYINFRTNNGGVQAVRITTTGNVGIGNTNATAKLHINSVHNESVNYLKVGGTGSVSRFYRYIAVPAKATAGGVADTAKPLYVGRFYNGTAKLLIYAGGNNAEEGFEVTLYRDWGTASIPILNSILGSLPAEITFHHQTIDNDSYYLFVNYTYAAQVPINVVNDIRFDITTISTMGDFSVGTTPTIPTLNSSNQLLVGLFVNRQGRVAVGNNINPAFAFDGFGSLRMSSGTSFESQIISRNDSNDVNSGYFILEKSRNGLSVQNGDALGTLLWRGIDSANNLENSFASIYAVAEGTIGVGPIPAGLYFNASSKFVFNGSAGELARISSSGNVGIGITNPQYKLHIVQNGDTLALESQVDTGRATLKLLTAGSDWEVGARGSASSPANAFYIYDNSVSQHRFVISDTGNIGIGTINPNRQLHISTSSESNIVLENTSGSTNQKKTRIYQTAGTNPSFQMTFVNDAFNTEESFFIASRSSGTTLGQLILAPIGGNVGIGTTNATTKLDVGGESTQYPYSLRIRNTAHATSKRAAIAFGNGASHQILIDTNGNGTEDFGIYQSNVNRNVLRIEAATGNVHIGKSYPVAAPTELSVNGYISESTDNGVTYHNVVTQQDVGFNPNQIPLNQYLGQLAFQDQYSPSGLRRVGGGSDDLIIDSNGNVGIGTTLTFTGAGQVSRLHVYTSADSGSMIHSQNISGGGSAFAGVRLQSSGGNAFWWLNSGGRSTDGGVNTSTIRNDAGDLRLQSSGSVGLQIQSTTGRIGVGTDSPAGQIDIRTGPQWGGFNYCPNLLIGGPRNNGIGILDSNNSNPWWIGNGGGVLLLATMPALGDTTTSPSIKVSIPLTGNVGIGTIAPAYKVHIGPQNGSHLYLASNNNNYGWIFDTSDFTGGVVPLRIFRRTDGVNTESVTILNQSGNVGIGVTLPTYKLQVNGSFAATTKSFVIDHPTKPGYKLRYGSLEGPENGVYVRGKLSGSGTINLPEYWTELVDEDSITVNLTPIGRGAALHSVIDISDNTVTVESANGEVNCFYTVFAERKDVDRLVTEYKS